MCRVLKTSEKDFDAFASPAYPIVGVIGTKGVALKTELLHKKENAAKKMVIALNLAEE